MATTDPLYFRPKGYSKNRNRYSGTHSANIMLIIF
jgi:hypothetical protein